MSSQFLENFHRLVFRFYQYNLLLNLHCTMRCFLFFGLDDFGNILGVFSILYTRLT